MTEAYAAENVRKDLAAEYNRIVCLLDELVNLAGLKSKLSPLPQSVLLGELRAFEALLGSLLATHISLRGPNPDAEICHHRSAAKRVSSPPTASPHQSTLAGDSGALPTPAAAEYLALSPATLETLRCRGGGPPFVKLGRRVVYRREDLDAWLRQRIRRSTSDSGRA
jgi:predicted DNA-binding transcriptional regulator AlpA